MGRSLGPKDVKDAPKGKGGIQPAPPKGKGKETATQSTGSVDDGEGQDDEAGPNERRKNLGAIYARKGVEGTIKFLIDELNKAKVGFSDVPMPPCLRQSVYELVPDKPAEGKPGLMWTELKVILNIIYNTTFIIDNRYAIIDNGSDS